MDQLRERNDSLGLVTKGVVMMFVDERYVAANTHDTLLNRVGRAAGWCLR